VNPLSVGSENEKSIEDGLGVDAGKG
jgi:hypothetical protein